MGDIATANQQIIVSQADSDDRLVDLFLNRQDAAHTKTTYATAIAQFITFIDEKPLDLVSVGNIQQYKDHLRATYKSDYTRRLKLDAVRSLFAYALTIGYLRFNVAAAEKTFKVTNRLAERILSEEEVMRLLGVPDNERDRLIVRLLYSSAMRVSELCDLCWRDVAGDTLAIHGKGDKTRFVKLSVQTTAHLQAFRPAGCAAAGRVFLSVRGNPLLPSTVFRVVRKAGIAAGLTQSVSPHWLRHAHASHALARGATVAVVKDTLGHDNVATTSKYLHIRPDDGSSLYLAV